MSYEKHKCVLNINAKLLQFHITDNVKSPSVKTQAKFSLFNLLMEV